MERELYTKEGVMKGPLIDALLNYIDDKTETKMREIEKRLRNKQF